MAAGEGLASTVLEWFRVSLLFIPRGSNTPGLAPAWLAEGCLGFRTAASRSRFQAATSRRSPNAPGIFTRAAKT